MRGHCEMSSVPKRTTANWRHRDRDPGRDRAGRNRRDGGVDARALRPLDRLIAATRRVAGGDYGERVDVRAVSELERVAGAFNAMAAAIEADVAARKNAEAGGRRRQEAAEHANRAKSTFLAAMSHEIRTPMIGVTGMLEVLARTDLTTQQRQMVSPRRTRPSRCCRSSVTSSTSRRSRPISSSCHPRPSRLETVVRAAAETFVHTASAKGLLLTWSADDSLAPAHVGDPLRVRQIVSNLISNAVKFTEAGGIEVAVTCVSFPRQAQTVEMAVSDTGIGIAPEQQIAACSPSSLRPTPRRTAAMAAPVSDS